MALAFVQKTPNGTTVPSRVTGATSLTTSAFGSSIVVNNLLVATCNTFRAAGATVTFTDLKTNTWATDVQTAAGTDRCHIGTALIATGGASETVTATASGSGTDFILDAIEISGQKTSSWVSTTALNSNISTTPSTGAIAGTGNCFYVGVFEYTGSTTTLTSRTNTQLHTELDTTYPAGDIQYAIGSGSVTLSWVIGASRGWQTAGIAISEASASDTLFAQAVM